MNEQFEIQFHNLCNENLLKTERLFIDKRQNYFSDFLEHIHSICIEIIKLQHTSKLSAISYIDYTMLYSNFINRRYVAEVWVYDDMSYLDKNQRIIGEYDISFLFVYFDKLWEELISVRKRYVGKVSADDVIKCMMQTLPDFYSYLTAIVRIALRNCIDDIPFADIAKNDVFRLRAGDYMAKAEVLYTINKKKDIDSLIKLIKKQCDYMFTFTDCSWLDFSGLSFRHTKLRYAQFRNSILTNVNLYDGTLVGTNFYKAKMENSNLDFSTIYETNFTGAKLKDASFRFAVGGGEFLTSQIWKGVGYLPTSFKDADLTNVDFCGASLYGADFRGATLIGTKFTDATLDNAIFSTRELPLSADQMSKIIVEGVRTVFLTSN